LNNNKWSDGKKEKGWRPLLSKKKSTGNEENGCLAPDLNKTMINVTKELSVTDIKTFKEEILEEI
jgi:hypothetical protein